MTKEHRCTAWTDYDLAPLKQTFDDTIGNTVEQCKASGITVIAPTKEQIDEVATGQDEFSAIVEDLTYCYVSPESAYKDDFDIDADTFYGYHKRRHTARHLLASIFRHGKGRTRKASKKLNYRLK